MMGGALDWRTLPAGRESDEIVCERFGIPGRVEYYASTDGGASGLMFSDYRGEVEAYIASTNARYPNSRNAGATVHTVTHYPAVTQDISAAWLVMERLADQDLSVVIATNGAAPRQNGAKVFESFRALGVDMFDAQRHEGWHAIAETVPLAIVRAALAGTEARP